MVGSAGGGTTRTIVPMLTIDEPNLLNFYDALNNENTGLRPPCGDKPFSLVGGVLLRIVINQLQS